LMSFIASMIFMRFVWFVFAFYCDDGYSNAESVAKPFFS